MRLGQIIPDFKAETTHGPISFHEWQGDSWCILFSHPADFTPVCTSELSMIASRHQDFWKRGVKLLAHSCDRLRTHGIWLEDVKSFCTDKSEFPYPVIADPTRELAVMLDMIDEDQKDNPEVAMTVRALYVIGPDRKLKLSMHYPNSTGRSVEEMIRVVDSLQLVSRLKIVATPSDWTPGGKVMILPHVRDEDLPRLFPGGVKRIRMPSGMNYLRTTPDCWREPWRVSSAARRRNPRDFLSSPPPSPGPRPSAGTRPDPSPSVGPPPDNSPCVPRVCVASYPGPSPCVPSPCVGPRPDPSPCTSISPDPNPCAGPPADPNPCIDSTPRNSTGVPPLEEVNDDSTLNDVTSFIDNVAATPNLRQVPLGELMQLTAELVQGASTAITTNERLHAMTTFLRGLAL